MHTSGTTYGNLTDLIKGLKEDLKSVRSGGNNEIENIKTPEDNTIVVVDEIPVKKKKWYQKYVHFFLTHCFFTTELFVFFVLLFSIIKPSFLYYNQKVIHNKREMIRTHFSFMYLFFYSAFFTGCIHIMILINSKFVPKLLPYY